MIVNNFIFNPKNDRDFDSAQNPLQVSIAWITNMVNTAICTLIGTNCQNINITVVYNIGRGSFSLMLKRY